MIKGRCPICSRSFQAAALADLPSFPFCSERCKLVDLGRWMDGAYAIPGPPVRGEGKTNAAPAEHHLDGEDDDDE